MNGALVKISNNRRDRYSSRAGREAVLGTLAYFDIFQYPLTYGEIKEFLGFYAADDELLHWLNELEAKGLVFHRDEFYLLENDPAICDRRIKGNEHAGRLMKKAIRIGRFLYQFPFVEAIGISGSLSKNFADETADIDFFVITRANRLWTARTLMHLFKKFTFLAGRQHYYCMNYYIDESAFRLDDKNLFTATEIKTLLPVAGSKVMDAFFVSNLWADDHLPACAFRKQATKDPSRSWLKKLGEWLLTNRAGAWLENRLMRLTQKRWNRKEERGRQNQKGLTMGLISGKHFARSNPGSLQEKILSAHRQRLAALEEANTAAGATLFLS